MIAQRPDISYTTRPTRPGSSAMLVGYYGVQNTGDDAFLLISAWAARSIYGCANIVATSHLFPALHGIRVKSAYHRWLIKRYDFELWCEANACRGASHIIFGGGSNFHSESGINQYLRMMKYAPKGRHFAAGVSIGPFFSSAAENACKNVLRKLAFIGVRDQPSYDRAKSLVPAANVEVTFDLAPILPIVGGITDPTKLATHRRALGVALCHYDRFIGKDPAIETRRMDVVVDAVSHAIASGSVGEIVTIDFNGNDEMGDRRVHTEFTERIPSTVPVRHVPYCDDPVAVLGTIAGLKGLLAMRLHAAVFGFCTGTPTIVYGYHEKCGEWARMIGQPSDLTLDSTIAHAADLEAAINLALSSNPPQPSMTWEDAAARAMRNWTWQDDEVLTQIG